MSYCQARIFVYSNSKNFILLLPLSVFELLYWSMGKYIPYVYYTIEWIAK